MMLGKPRGTTVGLLALALLLAPLGGCQSVVTPHPHTATIAAQSGRVQGFVPTEKDMVTHPPYRVEAPDILLVDAIKIVPKPPHRIQPLDTLQILVVGTLPDQPIAAFFPVDPSGMVDLGPAYGKISVAGKTIEEATEAIDTFLRKILTQPQVSVTLAQAAGVQQIAGQHLVGPDGTVNLGTYGSVYVAGLTLWDAKLAIEEHLSAELQDPEVAVDVFAYNSKVFYIITEGGGFGDQVVRLPVTGNETVLDALAQIGGLNRVSSTKIWIARPAPSGVGCDQILPVSWEDITRGAATSTNYQILPGDRVFIQEDRLIATDSLLAKIIAPFERVFGFLLLSSQTVQTMNRFPQGIRTGF